MARRNLFTNHIKNLRFELGIWEDKFVCNLLRFFSDNYICLNVKYEKMFIKIIKSLS